MITPEMKEILTCLSVRKEYALFAGFAGFLHEKIKCSADIDIFVSSKAVISVFKKDFVKCGWMILKDEQSKYHQHVALKKNKTTFDIIYAVSSKPFLDTVVEVQWGGLIIKVISKEALLLTKMNQVSDIGRSEAKTLRDRKLIDKLRREIDLTKLRNLLSELHDMYWTKGYL